MKKVLISTIAFIMAMLPLVLLSNSISNNVNSADVNQDGEVNISDVNAVIGIILGGAQEGLNGDVNNDGEINISDINYIIDIILGGRPTAVPVINTQTVDNAVIITATGNGIVNLYVEGQAVSNPYVAIRGDEDYYISVYATAQEEGKLMSQSETIRVLIPAKVMQPTEVPSINTDITEDAVIITASGNGIVNLYVDGQLVDNPYTAIRQESDYTISVYATAQEEGKEQSQSDVTNIVVPAKVFTAIPIVTTETTNQAVIIAASGDGIVNLYVNDLLVSNPYIAVRSTIDYEITVFATAKEEGKAMSQSNSQSIIVPALVINETETFTVNGVSFTMVYVKGGTFTMGATSEQGSDANDLEKPAHQVTLSSYSIGKTEVTQALWVAVMGSNPSRFTAASGYSENLQRPVEQVSWDMCQEFITKLNALTGKTFRLPTEAEWEYAARGGNKSQGYKFAGSNTLGDVAWYDVNAGSSGVGSSSPDYGTHTVATKTANELGLYDMSGNVWEWCQDWYGGSYSSEAQTNPTGPASGSFRLDRGGCWSGPANYCRVSFRGGSDPTSARGNLGLRLAL